MFISCKECIYGFIDSCPVGRRAGNAACITIHKPWREELKEKVIRALNNMKEIKTNEIEQWYADKMKIIEEEGKV